VKKKSDAKYVSNIYPPIGFVNLIAKTHSVDDCKLQIHVAFLQLCKITNYVAQKPIHQQIQIRILLCQHLRHLNKYNCHPHRAVFPQPFLTYYAKSNPDVGSLLAPRSHTNNNIFHRKCPLKGIK